jgi:hypothetical protein
MQAVSRHISRIYFGKKYAIYLFSYRLGLRVSVCLHLLHIVSLASFSLNTPF